jgi:hypothetical protein
LTYNVGDKVRVYDDRYPVGIEGKVIDSYVDKDGEWAVVSVGKDVQCMPISKLRRAAA